MNYVYAIILYQHQKNGKNYRIDFLIESKDDYNKALYKWDNDTTLRMKLYGSNSNLSSEFTQILEKDGGILQKEPYN